MKKKITLEFILNKFIDWVENETPISPAVWIDGAFKLNVLLEKLDEEIIEMEIKMSEEEMRLIDKGNPISKATILKRRAIEYGVYLSAVARKKRIEEFIRLAKKRQVTNFYMRIKRISDNKIIEIITKKGGQATAYYIEDVTGYTRQNVSKRLHKLKDEGRLQTLKVGRKLVLWSI